MKKLYVAFLALLAMSFGCAVTDYPDITDSGGGVANYTVNTNGKAIIYYFQGIAVIVGGNSYQAVNFVNQKADGNQSLTTYADVTPNYPPTVWIDYLYCAPDWTGCALLNTSDGPDATDPSCAPPDFNYDHINWNCWPPGTFIGLAWCVRPGECGRWWMTPEFQAQMFSDLIPVDDGWMLYVNRSNTKLTAGFDGVNTRIPLYGSNALNFDDRGRLTIKFTSNMKPTLAALSRTPHNSLTLNYKGQELKLTAQLHGDVSGLMAY
jgi:hypothetical protein